MELTQYTSAIFGLINARRCLEDSDKSIAAHHLRYLYKQSLYGYDQFAKKMLRKPHSENTSDSAAQGKSRNGIRDSSDGLTRREGAMGNSSSRHVYTMGMFDRAIRRLLQEATLNEDRVNRIVGENCAVAWIMKHEDCKLPKSHRGESLADALAVYEQCGIHLIPACDRVA